MFANSKYKNIYLHTLRNYKRNQKERARYAKQNENRNSIWNLGIRKRSKRTKLHYSPRKIPQQFKGF